MKNWKKKTGIPYSWTSQQREKETIFQIYVLCSSQEKYSWYSLGSNKTDGYSFIDPPVRPIVTEHSI